MPLNKETKPIQEEQSELYLISVMVIIPPSIFLPSQHICRGDTPNKCPWYDTKQSDGEVQVMLELWGMNAEYSFIAIAQGPLWPGAVAPDRDIYMGRIEQNCVLMLN